MDFERQESRNLWGPLPPSANEVLLLWKPLYSIPGSCYFKDFSWFLQVFIRFHEISWISRVGGRETCGVFAAECHRSPAPSETFTRSQLAAISSICMDLHDLHRFQRVCKDCVGVLECTNCFVISVIFN